MLNHHLALATIYCTTAIILLLDDACAHAICAPVAGLVYALMGRQPHSPGNPPPPTRRLARRRRRAYL